jgi:hypothetical protein
MANGLDHECSSLQIPKTGCPCPIVMAPEGGHLFFSTPQLRLLNWLQTR